MTTASVANGRMLDFGDAEVLHHHFADPYANPSIFDFATVEDHQFAFSTQPSGFRIPVRYGRLELPGHNGILHLDGYTHPAQITFSMVMEEVFAHIPMFGPWRSGRLSTVHERP